MMRPQQVPQSRTAKIVTRLWLILIVTVNTVSYLMMTFGLFRGFYYAYVKQDPVQFIWSVVMTVFAVYINLKNPNNK